MTRYTVFYVTPLSARGTQLEDIVTDDLEAALLANKFRLVRRSGNTLFVEHDSSL